MWLIRALNFGASARQAALPFLAVAGYDSSWRLAWQALALEFELPN
ncbi:hypothetical protein C4K23_1504 [Pseudomonas chlororaphis]|nr:hypothetical protein C4K23_1504 [Pseudomonas chlororaphis]